MLCTVEANILQHNNKPTVVVEATDVRYVYIIALLSAKHICT